MPIETKKTTTTSGNPAINQDAVKNRFQDNLATSGSAIADLKKLSEDPQFQATTPPDTQQSLKDALEKANQKYQQQTTRNDWADIAQTMAHAVIQFGAAQAGNANAGRFGNPMSGLNQPKIDYGARNDRALKELEGSSRQAHDLAAATRQDFMDKEKTKQLNFQQKYEPLRESARASEARDSEILRNSQMNRQSQMETNRENRADARAGSQQGRLEMGENTREMKDTISRVKAAETFANQYVNEDDATKKNLEKLQLKYGTLAGQAGINLSDVINNYEQNAPRQESSGVMGWLKDQVGMDQPVDKPAAYKNLLDSMGVSDMKKRIDDLRARNIELARGQSGIQAAPAQSAVQVPASPVPATSPVAVAPAGPSTVKLKGPSGQIAEMTQEAAKKYIGKPGYTVVQ